MSDKVYNTYSSKKPNALTTGITYGVNEMLESGAQMGLQDGRRIAVEGFTGTMEDGIMREMLQDGLNSAMSNWTGAIMMAQEKLLETSFNQGKNLVYGLYGASGAREFLKNKFKNKFKKGRKASLFAKFIGNTDSTAEKGRLIADFTKMDIDSSANSRNPSTEVTQIQRKQQFEAHEVNKEATRTRIASLQLNGLTRSFDWKLKTSSFVDADKPLIKDVTGLTSVSDEYIDKLNSQSLGQSFKDNNGNWIGGNQVTAEMLNFLNTNKVN